MCSYLFNAPNTNSKSPIHTSKHTSATESWSTYRLRLSGWGKEYVVGVAGTLLEESKHSGDAYDLGTMYM